MQSRPTDLYRFLERKPEKAREHADKFREVQHSVGMGRLFVDELLHLLEREMGSERPEELLNVNSVNSAVPVPCIGVRKEMHLCVWGRSLHHPRV